MGKLKNYEMTEKQLESLLEACKPVPCMLVGGTAPSSPQKNANSAWTNLGREMGFDSLTVKPRQGFSQRHFSAISK